LNDTPFTTALRRSRPVSYPQFHSSTESAFDQEAPLSTDLRKSSRIASQDVTA
jgi:hypothetical protein